LDVGVKFLVAAQLPRRLVFRLREAGHDALHTLDLPDGNRTSDAELNACSAREERAVVTKDADFVNSFLLLHLPYKLLLISTGNIRNADLEALLLAELPAIVAAFATHDYLELLRSALIIHL
jgi:predicted nuclease of predicted toxin-antitoxin system